VADFILTKRAQADLVKALLWGAEQFGSKQVRVYSERLRADMETLAERPNPGVPLRERPGVYWLRSGSHVLFYRLQARAKRARVIRILRQERMALLHLKKK
jgi:plasmid stabilization system protein ParE